MKLAVFILLTALAAFTISYRAAMSPVHAMLAQPESEMEWLRREFALSDEQFAKIKSLHAAYRPGCEQMCARIAASNEKLNRLIASNRRVTPALGAAFQECATVETECHLAMLGHIYAVSAEMSPESRERYLKMMKPRVVHSTPGSDAAISALPNLPPVGESKK